MGKRYDHLTAEDRKLIARLRDDGIPVMVIALHLGRHKSTIHRELRHNRTDDRPWLRGYFAMAAHQISAMRRCRSAKLHRDPILAAYVVARLEDGLSPEQIAGRLALVALRPPSATRRSIATSTGPLAGPPNSIATCRASVADGACTMRGSPEASAFRRSTRSPSPAEIGERTTFGH